MNRNLSHKLGSAFSLAVMMSLAANGRAAADSPTLRAGFHRSLVNLEYSVDRMSAAPPEGIDRVPPAGAGELWYGALVRGEAGGEVPEPGRPPAFAVRYEAGRATDAWFDANHDGDLTDDPPLTLYAYPPGGTDARSIVVDVRWVATADSEKAMPAEWKIRFVLEAQEGRGEPPEYRSQMVYAMEGTVAVGGRPHRAVLYDGNLDGVYTRRFADGMFIDLDDDGHIEVDPMSPEFAPFSVPFEAGGRRYRVTRVDPGGEEVEIQDLGAAPSVPPARAGEIAPDFAVAALDGRAIRLSDQRGHPAIVYFFASWCGTCAAQAAPLVALYRELQPKGLEIIGISYDSDRAALESYRATHGEAWPASFSGAMFWENPVGRLYRAGGAGLLYLVDANGVLVGKFTDVPQLADRVRRLMGEKAGGGIGSRWRTPANTGSE